MTQSEQIRADLGKGKHDFYRCFKCSSIITREEELEFLSWAKELSSEDEDQAHFCDCGSMKISYARLGDDDWRRPNVMRYTVKLAIARGLIPWLEKKASWLVPYADRLLESEILTRYDLVAWQIVKRVK